MPAIDYSRFYRYDDLMRLLRAFAAEHPQYIALEAIGRSHEGREIPLLTITNTATGPAVDKPPTGSRQYPLSSSRHRVRACTSLTG
jgi:hypothetical protein